MGHRFGERHDGDGRNVRAIRHIQGKPQANMPALLNMDKVSALGVLSETFLWFDSFGQLKIGTALPTLPDFEGTALAAHQDTTILSAAVKTLRATPVTLVTAPGAGFFVEFVYALLWLDYSTDVFTESTANLVVRYTGTSGAIASQVIECTGFIDQAADTLTNSYAKIDCIIPAASLVNAPLVLHNNGAGEYAGNASGLSLLKVRTYYRVHPVFA